VNIGPEAGTIVRRAGLHPADAPGADAACHDADPEIFFPDGPDARTDHVLAVAICRGCPIRTACAEWAIARPLIRGIWGGLTTKDRQEIRYDRARAAA
jgi:hypothetical protein